MWSKTRQILKSKLADSLKERVDFHYDVYRTNKCRKVVPWRERYYEMDVLSIIVDGDAWFCTNPNFYDYLYGPNKKTEEEVIREMGLVGCEDGWTAPQYVGKFLGMSIDEAFTNENYFIRLLAVLDSRVGKRRLRPLLDNIENEPEWFRKWIRLRCEAEGLCGKTEQQSKVLDNQPIMNNNDES